MSPKILEDVIRKKKIEIIPQAPAITKTCRGKTKRKFSLKILFWVFISLAVIFFLIILISFFVSATVKYTPKQELFSADLNMKAFRGNVKNNSLLFEIIQMSYEASQSLAATEVKNVESRANGIIIIYNNFSSNSQVLIKNTRFETPDGKIYRINETITVPGIQKRDSGNIPGSLEVKVYADKPGDKYNIGLTDFTIPGFKGDPRYEKIYGRSKTNMSGGFIGKAAVLSQTDIDKINLVLSDKIKKHLEEEITSKKPNGFILFNKALMINLEDAVENPKVGDVGDKFIFKKKGVATGFLLPEESFTSQILKNYLSENEVAEVRLLDAEKLDFTLISSNQDNTEIVFKVKGNVRAVWKVDEDSLSNDLLNIKDKNYAAVFKNYPAVERAEISFKPSWWQNMPRKKSKIKFEEVL
ncbi:MAG: hypothetical protein AB1643_00300 [Patescibacteria group bacterium]